MKQALCTARGASKAIAAYVVTFAVTEAAARGVNVPPDVAANVAALLVAGIVYATKNVKCGATPPVEAPPSE